MFKIIPRGERGRSSDPAPSRIGYRLHRLWLTPLFKSILRVGVPMASVAVAAGWYLSDPGRMDTIRYSLRDMRQSIEQRPEFMVHLMQISNASDEVAEDIREITPIDFPVSSFELDLPALKAEIEGLDAVARVDLAVRSGGVLQVDIKERIPAVVWRLRDGLELLDGEGHRVAGLATRNQRGDLPLVVGEGADQAVAEAMQIFAAAGPLAARLRGLIRVGERRWDLALTRNQRVMLPEDDPVGALERVIALDKARDLLSREVTVVDLRDGRRPVLRPGEGGIERAGGASQGINSDGSDNTL